MSLASNEILSTLVAAFANDLQQSLSKTVRKQLHSNAGIAGRYAAKVNCLPVRNVGKWPFKLRGALGQLKAHRYFSRCASSQRQRNSHSWRGGDQGMSRPDVGQRRLAAILECVVRDERSATGASVNIRSNRNGGSCSSTTSVSESPWLDAAAESSLFQHRFHSTP